MKKALIFSILMMSICLGHAATGKEVFEKTCIACHGANGKGVVPGAADFTNPNGVLKKDDKTLIKHITEGYKSEGSVMPMPAKGGNTSLTDADVKNVLQYIRDAFGKKK